MEYGYERKDISFKVQIEREGGAHRHTVQSIFTSGDDIRSEITGIMLSTEISDLGLQHEVLETIKRHIEAMQFKIKKEREYGRAKSE